MALHVIKKGLDLPIAGAPEQTVTPVRAPRQVAVLAADFIGMKPTMFVKEGDTVKRGQALFEDKKQPGVVHTAPGGGKVSAIHRGAQRALQSVVIELTDAERGGQPGHQDLADFEKYTGAPVSELDADAVRGLLLESGLWTSFRTRPYSKTPAIDAAPAAIFVTAMDTSPHAPDMDQVASGREADLASGLAALRKLISGKVYFCKAPCSRLAPPVGLDIEVEVFQGPHPAGLAGTHIALLEPVGRNKTVWTIGLQDTLAIGALFNTGKLDVTRVVSLAGPGVVKPRLIRTRLGASFTDTLEGELIEGELRIISGSVLSGRAAMGDVHGYLGRWSNQIGVVREGRERHFLGWMMPGMKSFSVTNLFASRFKCGEEFAMDTNINGSPRAIVPFGLYEKVMPLDILPTFLLKSLAMDDTVRAEELGCLELDEEDLALCTFVCSGKTEFGPILRRNLTLIEREG